MFSACMSERTAHVSATCKCPRRFACNAALADTQQNLPSESNRRVMIWFLHSDDMVFIKGANAAHLPFCLRKNDVCMYV